MLAKKNTTFTEERFCA